MVVDTYAVTNVKVYMFSTQGILLKFIFLQVLILGSSFQSEHFLIITKWAHVLTRINLNNYKSVNPFSSIIFYPFQNKSFLELLLKYSVILQD